MTETGFELSLAQLQALGGTESAAVRTIAMTCPIRPGDNADRISAHIRDLVSSYDILRTTFVRPAGLSRRLQSITAAAAGSDPLVDVRLVGGGAAGLAGSPHLADLAAILDADRREPFDLATGPAWRLWVTDTDVVLSAAAAVADERSLALLLAELCGGAAADADPLQFVDYASWEAEQLDDDSADARIARAYWTSALRGDASDASDAAAAADSYELPVLDMTAVAIGGSNRPLAMAPERWLASWASVLQRHAEFGAEFAVVALAVSGRADAELETAIGPYERYVPLVVTADPRSTLDDVTARVRADMAAASRFAVFAPAPSPLAMAAFAVRDSADLTPARGAFPLELTVTGTSATLWHAPHLVSNRRAEYLAAQLAAFVEATSADPSVPVAAIDVLGAAERSFLTEALTGESADLAPDAVDSVTSELFRTIGTQPGAAAVVCGATQLTYAELGARAGAVAAAVGPSSGPVAILLDRSTDAVAAAVGVLLTGAPYLSLDASNPPAFIAEQLNAAGSTVVVTDRQHAATLTSAAVRTLLVDDLPPAQLPTSTGPATGESTAYLIFTSGSTGKPKPVAVTHANVLAYARGVSARLGLDGAVRFAAVTGMSTDLGNTAVFGALLNGGTLEIVPADVVTDGPALGRLVADHGVTALKITPSHLRALLAAGDVELPLALLVLGGEALDGDLVAQARAAGVTRVVNHYGPTETTIGVFSCELLDQPPELVPIGRPLPHARAVVVDDRGNPTPLGAVGELLIGGQTVAAGYLGRPDETAERFVPDPSHPGRRLYRTGDLVRLLDDGSVVFVGRADGQVKIRGYRVELGEIEARLRDDDSVAQAAVIADDGEIYAYVVPAGGPVDVQEVRRRLGGRVPPHMVPARVVVIDALPLTASGKLDRRRLRSAGLAGSADAAAARRAVTAPRNDVEAGLVEIWRDVLPVSEVGIDDNFFQIGGHSLLATKVIARSRARFGVDLPLHVIFASPTVEAMAAEIDKRLAEINDTATATDTAASDAELSALLDELESLSDDEAARLLGSEPSHTGDDA